MAATTFVYKALDRNGGVLATSVDTWDIYINARVWKDPETAKKAAAD